VVGTRTANGYELTGEAPWVTGAAHADLLVTGATLESGEQILVAIPTDRLGVNIAAPLRLMALNESSTGSVNLDQVIVDAKDIVLGPMPQVMKVGATGGTGSLTTSAVAAGAAAHTLDGIRQEVASRPDLSEVVSRLSDEQNQLRNDILAASEAEGDPATIAEQLRLRANSLATRAAQAYVCCAKGAGFVSGHPAERAMREAMFFQVWSCPPAVTRETLNALGSS
jgi:alkylation response protein AidB-like acyl-CoA dehydrogenase